MFGRLGDFPVSSAKKLVFECLMFCLLICVCAAPPTLGHTHTAPAPLVTAEVSPASSTVHSAADALFVHMTAGSTAAPPSTAPSQRTTLPASAFGGSTVTQLQPGSATVPAPSLQVPSSCPSTSDPPGTALSEAASALFAHLSVVAPALDPVETDMEDKPALRRQTELESPLHECFIEFERIGKFWKRTRAWSGYHEVLKRKAGVLETQSVALATSYGELSPVLLVSPVKNGERPVNGSAPLRVPDKKHLKILGPKPINPRQAALVHWY